jgi:hypothetical protein
MYPAECGAARQLRRRSAARRAPRKLLLNLRDYLYENETNAAVEAGCWRGRQELVGENVVGER